MAVRLILSRSRDWCAFEVRPGERRLKHRGRGPEPTVTGWARAPQKTAFLRDPPTRAPCAVGIDALSATRNPMIRISGNSRQQGPPTRTPLSTSRTCQPERTEILRPNPWPPTRNLGVCVGPRRCTCQNGDCGGNKYLRNVWDMGEAQMRSCQAKPPCWLDLRDGGSPAWIRTTIHGSKGRCPTIRRPGKIG